MANNMQFAFQTICVLTLQYDKENKQSHSKHVSTEYTLNVTSNLDPSAYKTEDGLLSKAGVEAATNVFIQGLIANIKYAHQEKFKDESEHIRYIIAELERGFVAHGHGEASHFKEQGLPNT